MLAATLARPDLAPDRPAAHPEERRRRRPTLQPLAPTELDEGEGPVDVRTLARTYLGDLVELYHRGHREPVLLPPDVARTYAEARRKGHDHRVAVRKAPRRLGEQQQGGDLVRAADAYNVQAFGAERDISSSSRPAASPTTPCASGPPSSPRRADVSATIATRFDVTADLPQRSLALEASAGTGKTWTLTSLTVRYLAETDVELPDLLLVTFTRAATAELRERVRLRIAEALQAAEEALADPAWTTDRPGPRPDRRRRPGRDDGGAELTLRRDRLRRAAQQLDEATISTIHGFCQRMLQHAALEAGVDFDAVLLDDDADLLAEIVDDHLARELRPASADVGPLPARLRRRGPRPPHRARPAGGRPAVAPPAARPPRRRRGAPLEQEWTDAVERFRAVWTSGGRRAGHRPRRPDARGGAFVPRQRTFTAKRGTEGGGEGRPPGSTDRTRPAGEGRPQEDAAQRSTTRCPTSPSRRCGPSCSTTRPTPRPRSSTPRPRCSTRPSRPRPGSCTGRPPTSGTSSTGASASAPS
jgi:hypothetical protein